MKYLTFVSFAQNDDPEENLRVNMWLESWLAQDDKRSKIIFWDCSGPGKEFNLIKHEDLLVIRNPIIGAPNWNRSIIRNKLALMVDTPLICQTCADTFYSANFVNTLIETIQDKQLLVQCYRRRLSKSHWDAVKNLPHRVESLHRFGRLVPIHDDAGLGECQCMQTKEFIDIGGYYQLIRDRRAHNAPWEVTAAKDDTQLRNYIMSIDPNKIVFIHDNPGVFLLHLWHNIRLNSQIWDERHTNINNFSIKEVDPNHPETKRNNYEWEI